MKNPSSKVVLLVLLVSGAVSVSFVSFPNHAYAGISAPTDNNGAGPSVADKATEGGVGQSSGGGTTDGCTYVWKKDKIWKGEWGWFLSNDCGEEPKGTLEKLADTAKEALEKAKQSIQDLINRNVDTESPDTPKPGDLGNPSGIDNDYGTPPPSTQIPDGMKAAQERARIEALERVAQQERAEIAKKVADATIASRKAALIELQNINAQGIGEVEKKVVANQVPPRVPKAPALPTQKPVTGNGVDHSVPENIGAPIQETIDQWPYGKSGRISPVTGYKIEDKPGLNDEFGAPRPDGRYHAGVDIGAPIGTKAVATQNNGVVSEVGYQDGYGNVLAVDYQDGTTDFYAHLNTQTVQVGDRVNAGTQVGTVGVSGMENPSPHLHFEVRRTGVPGSQSATYSKEALYKTRLDPASLQGGASQQPQTTNGLDNIFSGLGGSNYSNSDFSLSSFIQNPVSSIGNLFSTNISSLISTTFGNTPLGTTLGNVVGNSFGGLFSGLFTKKKQPSNEGTGNTPVIPVVPKPVPASDLYAVANGVTATENMSTTSIEYRFAGYLGRIILFGENRLPVSDINANYGDTIFTKLSVDYQCDGTVDQSSIFNTAYSAFDPQQDTSKVLVAQYLPVTQTGTHCFFFETDVNDVVLEKSETNNKSNVYMFIVGGV